MQRSTGPAPPGRLLLALSSTMRQLRRGAGAELLDPAGFVVLHHVSCASGGRVSDLAVSLGLDASTVSRHVKHLEQGGFLARSSDPEDRRASLIALTADGRAVLEAAYATRADVLRRATEGWGEADRELLVALLERLAGDLEAAGTPTTAGERRAGRPA